jgi:hypothetical protein
MKRILVATILGVGLLAMAGSLAGQHTKKLAADGNPPPPFPWYVADGNPPPPFPPYPPNMTIPTLVADGNPPPPFPPYPKKVTGAAVPEQLIADGNPPPPFPPPPKPPAIA